MKKRYVSTLMAISLAAMVLNGCGGNASSVSESTNLQDSTAAVRESGTADIETEEDTARETSQEDYTSLRGNMSPTEEEINIVNTTLNDSYLGDVFDTPLPNDYSAYPYKEDRCYVGYLDAYQQYDDIGISGFERPQSDQAGGGTDRD